MTPNIQVQAQMKSQTQMQNQSQNHNITLRPATLQDAKPIAELGRQTFTASFGHSVPSQDLQTYLDESYTIENITKDIQDPNKDIIVATTTTTTDTNGIETETEIEEKRETILGFAQLTRNTTEPCLSQTPKTIELQRIYVCQTLHGSGIGKMLIEKMEEMALSQGFENIWLGVWEENFKAQKFYTRNGYVVIGDHGFFLGEVRQVDLIMVKRLALSM